MIQNPNYPEVYSHIRKDFEQYSALPMAVYVTAPDGFIVMYNETAKNFFSFYKEDNWIQHYYKSVADRKRILDNLKQTKDGDWYKNGNLEFVVNDVSISSRFFIKPYFTATGAFIGFLSLVFEITHLERFRRLDNIMPVSIFEIAQGHKVSYANQASNALFNTDNLKGVEAKSLFINEDDYFNIVEKLKNHKEGLKDEPVRLKKNNSKAAFIGKLTIVPEFNEGRLVKSKGILMDASFANFFHEVPVGLYLVTINAAGEHIIVTANKHFANIKGYGDPNKIEGEKINRFYQGDEAFTKFLEALEAEHKNGKFLIDYILPVVDINGVRKTVLVNARAITGRNGKIEGSVGAVVDITDNLTQQLTNMRARDYASLLHSYSAMIINVKETLEAIVRGHDDTSVLLENNEVNLIEAQKKIDSAITRLKKHFINYLRLRIERQLPIDNNIERINKKLDLFRKKDHAENKERSAWVRYIAKDIRWVFKNEIDHTLMPREIYKLILAELMEILRYARITSLKVTIQELRDNLDDIETFKEAITQDANVPLSEEKVDIDNILEEVVNHLGEYANLRNISIEKKFKKDGKKIVVGSRRELYCAFYNLVHNAIKYSWRKTLEDQLSTVVIDYEKTRTHITVTIQNWGVPIRKEEIESEIIFAFTTRGASSSDRERRGFGIGLWHARKIANRHNGELKLKSVATLGNIENDYMKPFLTTASFKLQLSIF